MVNKSLILLLLVLPVVSAAPSGTNEGGILTEVVDTFIQSRTDPPTGNIFTETINNSNTLRHYESRETRAFVEITYTATFLTNTDGFWRYTFTGQGGELQNCNFNIETRNNGLSGTTIKYVTQAIYCKFPMSLNGTDIIFTGSRSTESGTPSSIQQEIVSYRITGYYYLEPIMPTIFQSLTGHEPLEFVLIFGAIFFLMFFWAQCNTFGYQMIVAFISWIWTLFLISVFVANPWFGTILFFILYMVFSTYITTKSAISYMAKEKGEV